MSEAYPDFGTFYRELTRLHSAGRYREAMERAAGAQPHYPDDEAILLHFRASMAARLHDPALALRLLREALDAGYWYAPVFWESPELAALRGLDEFKALRVDSDRRHASALAAARPELFVHLPEQAREPLPVLLALHGNLHDGQRELAHWLGLLRQGWLVASAQSSQVAGPNRYIWDDRRQAERELQAHYNALRDEYPLEAGHFVVGGFSMGAETAIALALRGVLPADGFIAVAPSGPLIRELDEHGELLAAPPPDGLRGAIVIGSHDPMVGNVTGLADRLEAAGVPLRLLIYDGLGHDYPPGFAQRLPELIEFVVSG